MVIVVAFLRWATRPMAAACTPSGLHAQVALVSGNGDALAVHSGRVLGPSMHET